MASTLLFSTFDIPQAAIFVDTQDAPDLDQTVANLLGGNRYALGAMLSANTSGAVRYDLGSAVTKSIDHVIIARADILKSAGLTQVRLRRGSDGSAWTTQFTDNAMSSATLYGPRSDDYVMEITPSSAYRWWQVLYDSSAQRYVHSKISFGTWFDIGKNVDSYSFNRIPASEAIWRTDAGAEYQNRVADAVYQFTFTWRGLTAAKVQSFFDTIVRYKHIRPVFLYTPSAGEQHVILDNQRLIHAKCISASRRIDYGNYQILTASFEEVLG